MSNGHLNHAAPGGPVISFGVFSLDRRTLELRKNGVWIKIAPQAFQVLICLLDQPGELVLRDDLRNKLWPDDTHVDFEGSLNAIVRDLRQALGDSARNPRFIKTELRRGYRFIAPVQPTNTLVDAVSFSEAPFATTPEPAPKKSWHWSILAAALTIGVVLAGFAFRLILRNDTEPRNPPRVSQLTSFVGRAGHPTFSPDGTQVAFHWDGDQQTGFDIYVLKLGSEQFTRLTHDPADDLYPAWSPDGRDIAFLRQLPDGRNSIYLVPAAGGSERLIASIPSESALSWSPDGRWIAYSNLHSAESRASAGFGIYTVSLLSGQVRRLSDASPDWLGDQDPAFSPDGRWIAFVRVISSGVNEILIQEIDPLMARKGKPLRLISERQNSRAPIWTPDSQAVVFSSLRGGVRSLWKVPVSFALAGSQGVPELIGGENASDPAVDPAGTRIVYERLTVTDTLRVLPLCSPGAACAGQPRPLMYSRQLARKPAWSPDGKRIAFESYVGGRTQVWLCNSDGSNAAQLSSFSTPVSGTPRWSPDGRWLAMDSRLDGRAKIFLIDADTRLVRQLTTGPSEDMTPNFSRNGKVVYFVSNRSGDFQLWKIPVSGNAPSQVTRHGGFYAAESWDGKTLYYATGMQRGAIAQVPVNGGDERPLIGSLDYWPNFAVGRDGIYYVPAGKYPNVPVCYFNFATRKSSTLATLSGVNSQGVALSADGRSLLLSIRESVETNLMALDLAQRQ